MAREEWDHLTLEEVGFDIGNGFKIMIDLQ